MAKKEWNRERAREQAAQDEKLQEVIAHSALMKAIIDYAATCFNTVGYNREETTVVLNAYADLLVGWTGCYPEFRDTAYWHAVRRAIESLLPPDDADLYPHPDDMPAYRRTAVQAWQERQEAEATDRRWAAFYQQKRAYESRRAGREEQRQPMGPRTLPARISVFGLEGVL